MFGDIAFLIKYFSFLSCYSEKTSNQSNFSETAFFSLPGPVYGELTRMLGS